MHKVSTNCWVTVTFCSVVDVLCFVLCLFLVLWVCDHCDFFCLQYYVGMHRIFGNQIHSAEYYKKSHIWPSVE